MPQEYAVPFHHVPHILSGRRNGGPDKPLHCQKLKLRSAVPDTLLQPALYQKYKDTPSECLLPSDCQSEYQTGNDKERLRYGGTNCGSDPLSVRIEHKPPVQILLSGFL